MYICLIEGGIPDCFGNCASLRELQLNNNQITGPIPRSLLHCINLQFIWLEHNTLSGTIPDFGNHCTKLVELSLHHNTLTGEIPASLFRCVNLSHLLLQNNHLSGYLPHGIVVLANLRQFRVSGNELADKELSIRQARAAFMAIKLHLEVRVASTKKLGIGHGAEKSPKLDLEALSRDCDVGGFLYSEPVLCAMKYFVPMATLVRAVAFFPVRPYTRALYQAAYRYIPASTPSTHSSDSPVNSAPAGVFHGDLAPNFQIVAKLHIWGDVNAGKTTLRKALQAVWHHNDYKGVFMPPSESWGSYMVASLSLFTGITEVPGISGPASVTGVSDPGCDVVITNTSPTAAVGVERSVLSYCFHDERRARETTGSLNDSALGDGSDDSNTNSKCSRRWLVYDYSGAYCDCNVTYAPSLFFHDTIDACLSNRPTNNVQCIVLPSYNTLLQRYYTVTEVVQSYRFWLLRLNSMRLPDEEMHVITILNVFEHYRYGSGSHNSIFWDRVDGTAASNSAKMVGEISRAILGEQVSWGRRMEPLRFRDGMIVLNATSAKSVHSRLCIPLDTLMLEGRDSNEQSSGTENSSKLSGRPHSIPSLLVHSPLVAACLEACELDLVKRASNMSGISKYIHSEERVLHVINRVIIELCGSKECNVASIIHNEQQAAIVLKYCARYVVESLTSRGDVMVINSSGGSRYFITDVPTFVSVILRKVVFCENPFGMTAASGHQSWTDLEGMRKSLRALSNLPASTSKIIPNINIYNTIVEGLFTLLWNCKMISHACLRHAPGNMDTVPSGKRTTPSYHALPIDASACSKLETSHVRGARDVVIMLHMGISPHLNLCAGRVPHGSFVREFPGRVSVLLKDAYSDNRGHYNVLKRRFVFEQRELYTMLPSFTHWLFDDIFHMLPDPVFVDVRHGGPDGHPGSGAHVVWDGVADCGRLELMCNVDPNQNSFEVTLLSAPRLICDVGTDSVSNSSGLRTVMELVSALPSRFRGIPKLAYCCSCSETMRSFLLEGEAVTILVDSQTTEDDDTPLLVSTAEENQERAFCAFGLYGGVIKYHSGGWEVSIRRR